MFDNKSFDVDDIIINREADIPGLYEFSREFPTIFFTQKIIRISRKACYCRRTQTQALFAGRLLDNRGYSYKHNRIVDVDHT